MFDSIPHLIIGRNLCDSTETVSIGHQFTFNGWLLLGILLGEQNNHIKLLPQTFISSWAIYCFQQVALTVTKHFLEGLVKGKFHLPLLNIRWCWQNVRNFLEGKVSGTSQVSKLFQIHYCCYGTFHTVRGCAFSSNMSRDLTSRSLQ